MWLKDVELESEKTNKRRQALYVSWCWPHDFIQPNRLYSRYINWMGNRRTFSF